MNEAHSQLQFAMRSITAHFPCHFVPGRDEAARMWTKREAEWERERLARERLMAEVKQTSTTF